MKLVLYLHQLQQNNKESQGQLGLKKRPPNILKKLRSLDRQLLQLGVESWAVSSHSLKFKASF